MEISSAVSFGKLVERFSGSRPPETTHESLQQLAVVARYDTDQPIHRYNDPAQYWFRIVAGAARKIALSGDGRRHIVLALEPTGRRLCIETDDERIERYVRTGEPQDKAGAYAIQGEGRRLVKSIRGPYDNVVGMPMRLLTRLLGECGIPLPLKNPDGPKVTQNRNSRR